MGGESIIILVIFFITAWIMMGIGITQLKSETPVGFYSGEKPPAEDELTDVPAWNRKHGMMWLVYGMIIMLSGVAGAAIADSIWCAVIVCSGLLVPIVFMIWYHGRLVRKYFKER